MRSNGLAVVKEVRNVSGYLGGVNSTGSAKLSYGAASCVTLNS